MRVRKLVYVVDDDASFLRAIQRLLNEHGYDVAVFHSVEDFNDHAVLDDAFCLVLDIHLGDRSGIDLSRQLSKRGSSLPVIFMTANDSEVQLARQPTSTVAWRIYRSLSRQNH